MATLRCNAIKSGYVQQVSAGAVFPTAANTWYKVDGDEVTGNKRYLFIGFENNLNGIRHRPLQDAVFTGFVKLHNSGYGIYADACDSDFDPATLTYNNKPNRLDIGSGHLYGIAKGNVEERDFDFKNNGGSLYNLSRFAYAILKNRVIRLSGYTSTPREDDDYQSAQVVLSDGVSPPYLTITYDDTSFITSQIGLLTGLPATVNNGAPQTITWEYTKASNQNWCVDETWEQVSAVFYWKKRSDETWNSINISGPAKTLTIPANTFPTGAGLEYYLSGTDEDGTTTQTSVFPFSTPYTQITPTNSPTSGYVNPRQETSFSWNYDNSYGSVPAGETTLYWRVSGETSWTQIQAETGANSLTVPANTFPVNSSIEWRLSGRDSTGWASATSNYTFSTAAGTVTATAVSPSNTVQSNNQPITFNWTFSSTEGFAPSRYQFLWKLATDAEYTTLLDETTIVTEYTFTAYTFPAGEIQWMIIPYNIDGVEGTGQATTFICYGAPEAPVIYVENTPFTTVRWQANDQQAYQIKVNDTVYGPYFGTEKTFELPDKLEDGEHSISVSIVGTYGLWSDWGTSVINVQNAPGEEIVLTGVSGIDNMLRWETEEATADFLIFRDGVQIGHTARTTFADRYASGEHSYQVLNRLTDGNYSESNTVTLETTAAGTYITERVGGEWLEIKYSKMDMRDPDYEETADGTFYHLAGNTYPSGSLSGFRESKVNFSALFLAEQETDRKRFESLLGKEVILKFRDGTVFTTVLNNWKKELKKLSWTAYSFTLQRIETEDYVDDTT